MKKLSVVLSAFAISTLFNNVNAQDFITSRNIFFVQFGGQGNKHSLNYEHIFISGDKMSYSYSVGYAPSTNRNFSVPLSINAYTTPGEHHLDLGFGVIPGVEYARSKPEVLFDKKLLFINPTIGYRYQKATPGLFLKAGVGPKFLIDKFNSKLVGPCLQIALGANF